MRRVRATGVEAVFMLAEAKRRARAVRPRAIHINEQKEETNTVLVDLDGGKGRVRLDATCWGLVCRAHRKAGRLFGLGRRSISRC